MKEFENSSFWNRVDSLLKSRKKTLTDLCNSCKISYASINTQRKRDALPKAEQLYAMAQYLETSMEYLIAGIEPEYKLPERLRIIVDYLMEDESRIESALNLLGIKKGDSSSKGA